MKATDIQTTARPLVRATLADVDALESEKWITFPSGYREFVTTVGEGLLGGIVRIYPPWRISKELFEWRRRISKYWFWDDGRAMLPKERALECVIIGDTINGDELIFHPLRPGQLFVLPRDAETVFLAGTDLWSAGEWMLKSGTLVEPVDSLSFEPFDSRTEPGDASSSASRVADPDGEALDDLIALAQRWAERHSARKQSRANLKDHAKGRKSTMVFEAIVLDGQFPYQSGYVISYRLDDSTSGAEVGTFTWHKTSDSYGGVFTPTKQT